MSIDDEIFMLAVAAGCQPDYCDGLFGVAWHCTCRDSRHGCDQQCSMITKQTLGKEHSDEPTT